MLSREENELLTRTGPGTAAGDLLRAYWQPAALSEELPAGGAPVPLRLMSEDLVLFRDDAGRPGLLGLHCSHRGADLSYGRIEDGGLRCLYHGWLYDVDGDCLDQPGEPEGSTFNEKVHHLAYPCAEVGGIIYAYMGRGEPPPMPAFEFITAPVESRSNAKVLVECNYLQGAEGNFDPTHLSFLHQSTTDDPESAQALNAEDRAPTIEAEENGVWGPYLRRQEGARRPALRARDQFPDPQLLRGVRPGGRLSSHLARAGGRPYPLAVHDPLHPRRAHERGRAYPAERR